MMQKQVPKGFRKPKALTKKQEEDAKRTIAFRDGYLKLCRETKLSLGAIIVSMGQQAYIKMQLQNYVENTPKSWSDSLRENLVTRQQCEHKTEAIDSKQCLTCGLEVENWAEKHQNDQYMILEGRGATEAYALETEKRIADEKVKEEEALKKAMVEELKEDDSVDLEEANPENEEMANEQVAQDAVKDEVQDGGSTETQQESK